MGLNSRAYLPILAAAGLLAAIAVLAPYRSEIFTRDDGVEVSVPPTDRLGHAGDVWDYLQQARQVYRGEGLTSLFTYVPFLPESVENAAAGGDGTARAFPVFWRQPGYTLLVAGVFLLTGGPHANALVWLHGAAIVLLPLAVYGLGRVVLTPGWAALAGLFTLLSPAALGVRDPLVATTLFAVIVPCLFWAAFRARSLPGWIGLGVFLGAASLFRLETWLLAPGILFVLYRTQQERRSHALFWVLTAAVLVLLPWHVRLALLTGDPFYNATSLMFHDTTAFPGWAASRTLAVRDLNPFAFVLQNLGEVANKTALNLLRWMRDLVFLPSPVLVPLWCVAVLRPPRNSEIRTLLWGGIISGSVLLLVLAPMEYASRFLAPLVSLLSVGAVVSLSRLPRFRMGVAGGAFLGGMIMVTAAVGWSGRAGSAEKAVLNLDAVIARNPGRIAEGVAFTDAPTVYAWIWDRPSVWAPVPGDVDRVRRLLPRSFGIITCSAGHFDGLEPDLVRDYIEGGAVTESSVCPWFLTWPASSGSFPGDTQ